MKRNQNIIYSFLFAIHPGLTSLFFHQSFFFEATTNFFFNH